MSSKSDHSCLENNGYLPIIKEVIKEVQVVREVPAVGAVLTGDGRQISEDLGHGHMSHPLEPNNDQEALMANQMPPEYDEEVFDKMYPDQPESIIDDQERAVDFTRDRTPGEREEIGTRCGADRIFVPNGFKGKTSVLNLYVSNIISSEQLQKLFYNQIGLEDIMQISWRYLNGDTPVGGVMDVQKRETFSISQALEANLISKKEAIMMLEAQACTGKGLKSL